MHPSFIRGFVKQCYASGLSEDQAEAALKAWGLREQLEDPDFRAGFDKKASAMDRLTQGWNSLGRTGQGAVVGGGAGALAGLIGGGKNKLRNMLMGGGAGAGLGALGGHLLGSRAGGAEVNDPAMHGDLAKKVVGNGGTPAPSEKSLAALKHELDPQRLEKDIAAGVPQFGHFAPERPVADTPEAYAEQQKSLTRGKNEGLADVLGDKSMPAGMRLAALARRALGEKDKAPGPSGMFLDTPPKPRDLSTVSMQN